MTDQSDLIEQFQAAAEITGDELLHAAASALSSQSLSLSEALERCAGWAVSFAKKCEEHQEALREIERLKGLVAGIRECPQEPAKVDASAWKTVPIEPTPELLRSMAIRYDHGLGVEGYYDQPMFGGEQRNHAKRLEATIRTMRQLHEEVVGTGFYRPPSSLENCKPALADANTNPASPDLSSLRKGAEDRETIARAIWKFERWPEDMTSEQQEVDWRRIGPHFEECADAVIAALVSGSREDGR